MAVVDDLEALVRGIVLAGGSASRLWPTTLTTNKHLLPVFDKPLIYYPLSTLMLANVREILVVTGPRDLGAMKSALGDGSQWGMSIKFEVQTHPGGIAQGLLLGRGFLSGSPCALVLGDNIFHGAGLGSSLQQLTPSPQAAVFMYEVDNPSEYACLAVDSTGRPLSLEEKPTHPKSRFAVPGLYFYPSDVGEVAAGIQPSHRGELEITDVNLQYLAQGRLKAVPLPRGTAWLDAGTPERLADASNYVRVLQDRQGMLIASPEEVALGNGWLSAEDFEMLLVDKPNTTYYNLLRQVLANW